MQNIKTDFHTK